MSSTLAPSVSSAERMHQTVRSVNWGIPSRQVLLSLDALLERYLPRGKEAVPRWLGRVLLRMNSQYLTTRPGTKLVLSQGSLDIYAATRLTNNSWGYHDFLTCVAAPPDGATFFDIGANVGYFSLEMAAVCPSSHCF